MTCETVAVIGCNHHYHHHDNIQVTCETVAVIGATLANGGVAPITGEKVLKPDAGLWHFLHFVNSIFLSFSLNHIQSSCIFVLLHAVRDVLSLLHSCGFYEYSGEFAFKVDLVLVLVYWVLRLQCVKQYQGRLSLQVDNTVYVFNCFIVGLV